MHAVWEQKPPALIWTSPDSLQTNCSVDEYSLCRNTRQWSPMWALYLFYLDKTSNFDYSPFFFFFFFAYLGIWVLTLLHLLFYPLYGSTFLSCVKSFLLLFRFVIHSFLVHCCNFGVPKWGKLEVVILDHLPQNQEYFSLIFFFFFFLFCLGLVSV